MNYSEPALVTTLHDLEQVFKLMQENNIGEVSIGRLVIKSRQAFQMPTDEKAKTPVTDEDILRNPYVGLQS